MIDQDMQKAIVTNVIAMLIVAAGFKYIPGLRSIFK